MKYSYCVNTFTNDEKFNPIQLTGIIDAISEINAIEKLKQNNTINSRAYEFLELAIKEE